VKKSLELADLKQLLLLLLFIKKKSSPNARYAGVVVLATHAANALRNKRGQGRFNSKPWHPSALSAILPPIAPPVLDLRDKRSGILWTPPAPALSPPTKLETRTTMLRARSPPRSRSTKPHKLSPALAPHPPSPTQPPRRGIQSP
jgi:hypothetical protein